jgi:hypothetical protein
MLCATICGPNLSTSYFSPIELWLPAFAIISWDIGFVPETPNTGRAFKDVVTLRRQPVMLS